jgi:hypothetical protein
VTSKTDRAGGCAPTISSDLRADVTAHAYLALTARDEG